MITTIEQEHCFTCTQFLCYGLHVFKRLRFHCHIILHDMKHMSISFLFVLFFRED